MTDVNIIAIDGPTASGKGTVSAIVAKTLGFHYLDSGALYRLCALRCLQKHLDLSDEPRCADEARDMRPTFSEGRITMDGVDVTDAIREEAVGVAASKVAALPRVRAELLDLQRRYAQAPGLVADGRDMASVVFPQAQLKVFLTASAQARALRRYNQLIAKGISANLANLTRDLLERDRRDRERAVAPCIPTPEAKVLDSSSLTIEETVSQVLAWWKAR